MTWHDIDAAIDVFSADGTYSAFGDTYTMADFRRLTDAASQVLYSLSTPALELDGDAGPGVQPLCYMHQADYSMGIGYYTDTYQRTPDGRRISTRAMTLPRRSGARDPGRPHEPDRPLPVDPQPSSTSKSQLGGSDAG